MSKSDSIPDWIYILLTLLVVGARLIKSVFAQEKTTRPQSQSQQVETTSQSIFHTQNSFGEDTVDNATESFDKPTIERIELVSAIENDVLDNREEETELDLRKAVVYKEILSRKYK
ncbi:hypothetical protein [Odoribacter lunatus]|uniref:hypothetical protein n=1 Tax=Odoribacter lunatus TaxID=2941335 RepID=UPI002041B653|nr:hypothetical protein [Odoribacter lunatus]